MTEENPHRPQLVTTRARVLGGTYRTFYSEPLTVASASGCTITDADGRDFLDAYNNVPVLGHSNPEVRRAVDEQLGRANVHTRYLDGLIVDYAERLVGQFPDSLEAVIFACSGSEANDLALRLAAHATGRDGIIVTRHSYHGTTSAVAGISPSLVGADVVDHVEAISLPDWDDPDFDTGLASAIQAAAERLRERGHDLGAFIFDSAVTSDGILSPRPLTATAAEVRRHGGLWIADEVQSGFGRTGRAWGFEHLGVVPDLVTLGKPMGNGLPVSAVIGPHRIFDDFGAEQRYFNTFAGTAVPIAAAEVVLTALEAGALTARASEGGELLESLITEAVAASDTPALVRRSGLMVGIDFETGGTTAETAAGRAKAMVEHLYAERILVSTTGRMGTVLKIRPPLVITDDELHELAGGFARALARLEVGSVHAGE
ncbi:aspartate aminotransferase family protein [Brevibacterium renqingii]|uniref:aspartate aminotransferase family protein n=1 Tax=Brevibacterium renqingii TaxID=2776916 RepID=UPI001ADF9880|nr:aminotransferase class III-fold pyridoxal phosphate-dependent enzyme [Brevibacterium renqingii]